MAPFLDPNKRRCFGIRAARGVRIWERNHDRQRQRNLRSVAKKDGAILLTILSSSVARHKHRRISGRTLFGHIRMRVRNIQAHVEGKTVGDLLLSVVWPERGKRAEASGAKLDASKEGPPL